MRIRRARKRGLQALRSRGSREPTRKRRIGITSLRRRARTFQNPATPLRNHLAALGSSTPFAPPHFDRSPTLAPDASAATIPGVWSVPLTTIARGIIRMAYPIQTNTPPTTPAQRIWSWRKVVVRSCCVIAS